MPEPGGQGLQILADPLTLSKPERVDYAPPPPITTPPRPDFQTFWRPCEAYHYAIQLARPFTNKGCFWDIVLQKTNAKVLEAVSKKALLIEVAANSITLDISSPIWV